MAIRLQLCLRLPHKQWIAYSSEICKCRIVFKAFSRRTRKREVTREILRILICAPLKPSGHAVAHEMQGPWHRMGKRRISFCCASPLVVVLSDGHILGIRPRGWWRHYPVQEITRLLPSGTEDTANRKAHHLGLEKLSGQEGSTASAFTSQFPTQPWARTASKAVENKFSPLS